MTDTKVRKAQLVTIREHLNHPKYREQLELAAGKSLDVKRLVRFAMTDVQLNPRLMECDIVTLAGALVRAAQLGLYPGGGLNEAHLVPYHSTARERYEVSLIPGYRGLLKLARRSGLITVINAVPVFERDEFEFQNGTEAFLHHKPYMGDDDPGTCICAYMLAQFSTGEKQFDVIPWRYIKKIKDAAIKKAKGAFTPWKDKDAEPEMIAKTAIRHGSKLLPADIEQLHQAVSLDEQAERGEAQSLQVFADEDAIVVGEPAAKDADAMAEATSLFAELQIPAGQRTALTTEYTGRVPDLVAFLKSSQEANKRAKTKRAGKSTRARR